MTNKFYKLRFTPPLDNPSETRVGFAIKTWMTRYPDCISFISGFAFEQGTLFVKSSCDTIERLGSYLPLVIGREDFRIAKFDPNHAMRIPDRLRDFFFVAAPLLLTARAGIVDVEPAPSALVINFDAMRETIASRPPTAPKPEEAGRGQVIYSERFACK